MISTDVLIIGGGLSGLALADQLQRTDVKFHLLEARARFGGRIKVLDASGGKFDLGPSWFWPGQPRMAAIAQRFGLNVFDQYATGALSYENEQGDVMRNQGWSSMEGSLRIAGGMTALVDRLVKALPAENLTLNQPIARLVRVGEMVEAFDANGDLVGQTKQVVLALPPRVASKLTFEPALPGGTMQKMNSISTWMAGHAKFVAVYDTAFWRTAGLSGDAMSRHGPMVEIHDASDPRSGLGAIFGFLGVPANIRAGQHQVVIDACVAQLARVFGSQAREPVEVFLQDWAFETETSTTADQTPPLGHPHYGMPQALADLWDGKLLFGSTEVAPQFGGFLEGALEAAENAAQHISAARSPIAD